MKNKILKVYLEKLFNKESIFPIDSVSSGKPFKYNEDAMIDPSVNDKKRIMIDFDGVIHKYDQGWKNGEIYGELIEGTKEAINELKDLGFEIVIFTSRVCREHNTNIDTNKLLSDLENWLNSNEIHYDKITSEKLGAIAYIDDRAIRFENNWNDVLNKVKSL